MWFQHFLIETYCVLLVTANYDFIQILYGELITWDRHMYKSDIKLPTYMQTKEMETLGNIPIYGEFQCTHQTSHLIKHTNHTWLSNVKLSYNCNTEHSITYWLLLSGVLGAYIVVNMAELSLFDNHFCRCTDRLLNRIEAARTLVLFVHIKYQYIAHCTFVISHLSKGWKRDYIYIYIYTYTNPSSGYVFLTLKTS